MTRPHRRDHAPRPLAVEPVREISSPAPEAILARQTAEILASHVRAIKATINAFDAAQAAANTLLQQAMDFQAALDAALAQMEGR